MSHRATRDDALAAWTEYRESGLHVTGGEADAWLGRLEAGENPQSPTPHE